MPQPQPVKWCSKNDKKYPLLSALKDMELTVSKTGCSFTALVAGAGSAQEITRYTKLSAQIITIICERLTEHEAKALMAHTKLEASPTRDFNFFRSKILVVFKTHLNESVYRANMQQACFDPEIDKKPSDFWIRLIGLMEDYALCGSTLGVSLDLCPHVNQTDRYNCPHMKLYFFYKLGTDIYNEVNNKNNYDNAAVQMYVKYTGYAELLLGLDNIWAKIRLTDQMAQMANRTTDTSRKRKFMAADGHETDYKPQSDPQADQLHQKLMQLVEKQGKHLNNNLEKMTSSLNTSLNALATAQSMRPQQLMQSQQYSVMPPQQSRQQHIPSFAEQKTCPNKFPDDLFTTPLFAAQNVKRDKVCWICGNSQHFLPQCPYVSRLELLIFLGNSAYRKRLNNPTEEAKTIESLCEENNVDPPTAMEKTVLSEIYGKLKNKVPKRILGTHTRAYCPFCHANGHYGRNCIRECPYCWLDSDKPDHNHGWNSCKNPKFRNQIDGRMGKIQLMLEEYGEDCQPQEMLNCLSLIYDDNITA